jgi:hypothetical protein
MSTDNAFDRHHQAFLLAQQTRREQEQAHRDELEAAHLPWKRLGDAHTKWDDASWVNLCALLDKTPTQEEYIAAKAGAAAAFRVALLGLGVLDRLDGLATEPAHRWGVELLQLETVEAMAAQLQETLPPGGQDGDGFYGGVDRWLRSLLRQVAEMLRPAESLPPAKSTSRKKGLRGMTIDKADREARRLEKQMKTEFFKLSQNKQAKKIGCSWGTWSKTPFYQECLRQGRIYPSGRKKDSSTPGVVSFTKDMEGVTGDGGRDSVLEKLTQEEGKKQTLKDVIDDYLDDYEPSPLEDDPLDEAPRKTYRLNRRR